MPQSDDPSPEEIKAACWRIQSGWSEKERLRRCAWTAAAELVEPRRVATAEIVA